MFRPRTHAEDWLKQVGGLIDLGQCAEPLVSASADGEVVLEWWSGSKKLTLYLGSDSADYVKVWGADIVNQMEDGVLKAPTDFNTIWAWLVEP